MRLALAALLLATVACANTPNTNSFGNSTSSIITGDRVTVTETFNERDQLVERETVAEGKASSETSDSRDSERSVSSWLTVIGGVLAGQLLF